jgi:hypothetical protein
MVLGRAHTRQPLALVVAVRSGHYACLRTFQIISAGQRRAHEEGRPGKVVRARLGGLISIRSSIERSFFLNNRIHSPYGSWKSTVLSADHSDRRMPKYGLCNVLVTSSEPSGQHAFRNGVVAEKASRPSARRTRAASGTVNAGSAKLIAP